VPGLPAPLWTSPVVPIELLFVVPLTAEPPDVDPVAELPLVSLLFFPIGLHAARDSAVRLPMRMP
jgi:hypothetical protein